MEEQFKEGVKIISRIACSSQNESGHSIPLTWKLLGVEENGSAIVTDVCWKDHTVLQTATTIAKTTTTTWFISSRIEDKFRKRKKERKRERKKEIWMKESFDPTFF